MRTLTIIRATYLLRAALVIAISCGVAIGQPDRAEAVFAEAKALAAAESVEEKVKAIDKFAEATRLFQAAGNKSRVDEVQLAHGQLLRALGVIAKDEKMYSEAIEFFQASIVKFKAVSNQEELGFACHDLGWIFDQQERTDETVNAYNCALRAYTLADNKPGLAVILRNLGVVAFNQRKSAESLDFLKKALAVRVEMNDVPVQAMLHLDIGDVYAQERKYQQSIAEYNEGLRLYRQAADKSGEVSALIKLGGLPSYVMKLADATRYLETALKISEDTNDYTNEASSLWTIGRMYMSNMKPRLAEPFLNRAADTYMILEDASNEAGVAIDLAANYESLNRYQEARTAVERALKLARETKNKSGEAFALLLYAEIHSFFSEHAEALAKIEAAKKLFQEANYKNADIRVTRALVNHYYQLSNYDEAIRYSQIALGLAEKNGDEMMVASAYIDIANSYSALGEKAKSNEYTSKALAIARKLDNKYTESICLSNLGYGYWKLGDYARAETSLKEAIVLMQANGYELEEGYATHNLGLVYYKRRQYAKALAAYDRALPLYRKAGDRRPESFLYDSYGELYRDLGQYEKAVDNLQRAVVLAREIRYSEVEANALGNTMLLWMKRGQPRLGILYGKQAVNMYQSIRATNRGVDKSARKSLIQTNEKTYRQLANLLIDEGRLAEAQQVLDLLKAEEYFEFVRRDASEAGDQAMLALSDTEKKALEEYSRVSAKLTALGVQYQTLQDKKNKNAGKLSETEEAEYQRLKKEVEDAGEGLKTFFSKLVTEFSKKVEDGTVVTPQSIETLRADLRRAGPDVVLVSTYLLPERYRAIVTTGRTMVDRKVEYSSRRLTGADINRKIFEFQRALQNPRVDPRPLGKELYDIFVKPLEGDLRGAGAKTILWSLDGSLRYIPMAALSPDGKTYLAEQYQNVVVTLGRQTNLFAKPATDEWRAIGAGVSKQHAGFAALPSVPEEIGSIVHDAKNPTGVLDGTRMLDEQFNLESLRATVPQQTDDGKPFNVLHLATHFSLGASDQDSALLLGDGTRLSLFDIGRDEALDFKDVELLTLSACQTAVSTGDANGREVESLGMLAQKKGAKAVLATLWKVADESTSMFMAEFYRIKKANPTMNKAEAIRLAQKEMIDGRLKSSGKSVVCRADEFASGVKHDEFKCDPNAPYSHPYFWSPFVLIGNWR